MAPSAVSPPPSSTGTLLVKPWSRPQETKEDLDWAPLTTIDLSRFDEPGGKQDLAKQLYDAITRVGFWVVTGTGIDDERILRQFSIGNTFFKEPLDEKRRFPCNFAEGEYFGYRENERWIGDTGVKENIEMLNIHKDIPAWTQVGRHRVVEDNWDEIRNFHRDVWEVARKLFVLIAIILELPENYLADAHAYDQVSDDHLRYMIYNVRTDEEWDKAQAYSKGGHTDFGSLTLLFSQHVAGLQIRTPEGDWKYVKPVEGGITCNAADTLTFLTNDSNLKKVTLELGGKSPSIVFGSANLDEVVEWVNGGIFYNMGQNCCASSRVFVHESVYESFMANFVERARKNQLGDPFDKTTFLGPQISGSQHSKIMGMIEKAKTQGAICATGGRSPSGWFIEPTIFRDVKMDMEIAREEVFGPVVAVASFRDEEEALAMAHDTCYGLAAAVFTSDIKQGIKMAKELEAGTVWVNCYNKISHALPFGGYRQSGNGKDLGEDVIYGFTQLKTIGIML
ncbi:Aldehyde dehydrogenase [Colletotrichum sp. SAR 10_98]|nr:Aldehyde dehydrogenase [Colletotrichum sp. SAR 10_98]